MSVKICKACGKQLTSEETSVHIQFDGLIESVVCEACKEPDKPLNDTIIIEG